MTAPEAIRQIEELGVDVYVRPGGDVWLRSRAAGEPVSKLAIAFARANRQNIAAYGTEFTIAKPKASARTRF